MYLLLLFVCAGVAGRLMILRFVAWTSVLDAVAPVNPLAVTPSSTSAVVAVRSLPGVYLRFHALPRFGEGASHPFGVLFDCQLDLFQRFRFLGILSQRVKASLDAFHGFPNETTTKLEASMAMMVSMPPFGRVVLPFGRELRDVKLRSVVGVGAGACALVLSFRRSLLWLLRNGFAHNEAQGLRTSLNRVVDSFHQFGTGSNANCVVFVVDVGDAHGRKIPAFVVAAVEGVFRNGEKVLHCCKSRHPLDSANGIIADEFQRLDSLILIRCFGADCF